MAARTETALALAVLLAGTSPAQRQGGDADPARAFFAAGGVVRVEITLQPEDRQRLRERPREYVPAALCVDGAAWAGAGVKLKGAAGSFRKVDDRPGFTVNLGKFGGEARLHGLRRFHLNNGVQDQSRLCEWLGHEVFAAAGLPAPRVMHALVRLDGADLGLYVLREGYDEQFLARAFGTAAGNLYDGGFCRDIDSDLEKDAGDGSDDRADLRRLREACREFDPERPTRFAQAVDVDALIDFCAVEAMLGHWDGYSQNRNNFRLWIASDGGARFLPHGMDQLLGDPDASILGPPSGIVARALMQRPEWRARYRERLVELLPLLSPRRLGRRLEAVSARIERALRDRAPDVARQHGAAARQLAARLEERYRSLKKQVRAPEPEPLAFPGGRPVTLAEWRAAGKTDHVDLDRKGYRGVRTLQVICRQRTGRPLHGLYRTTVLLARGRYRLSAVARCEGVEAGAGDRAIGVFLTAGAARSAPLVGDASWRPVELEFEVGEPQRDVELALELRALQGRAWFRLDSLRLERLP